MKLSEEQSKILDAVLEWFREGYTNVVTIVGYAGTGKTTLMAHIASKIRRNKDLGRSGAKRIAFCAFAGKAAFVLENKLMEFGNLTAVDYVGTIHGLLYSPVYKRKHGKKIIVGWKLKPELDVDLIVVDEGSMVSKTIWDDLRAYGIPIIICGDHGQLPPIGPKFDLLANADHQLVTIHRQALNNPIIKLSVNIRRTGCIPPGYFNKSVFKLDWNDPQCQKIYDQISWQDDGKDIIQLCGFNNTRVGLNNKIRTILDFKLKNPYPGERVMCLKNNHNTGIKNGMLGTVVWAYNAGKDLYDLTMNMDGYDDELHSCLAHRDSFAKSNYNDVMEIDFKRKYAKEMKHHDQKDIDLFDFGYATTVHKSQGSEWPKVVLFEQRNRYQSDQDYARWLYTAATRAKEKLFIIYNYWG